METLPRNCVLLTPQEAAELYANYKNPVYVVRDGEVRRHCCFSPDITQIMGTGFSIVGTDDTGCYLCVRKEEVPMVDMLTKKFYELVKAHGHFEGSRRWEVLCADSAAGDGIGVGDVDELGHADSVAEA